MVRWLLIKILRVIWKLLRWLFIEHDQTIPTRPRRSYMSWKYNRELCIISIYQHSLASSHDNLRYNDKNTAYHNVWISYIQTPVPKEGRQINPRIRMTMTDTFYSLYHTVQSLLEKHYSSWRNADAISVKIS